MTRVMGFIGVTTGSSAMMRIFPTWATTLGLGPCELRGHDLPLGASDGAVRALVSRIRDDERYAGALVTTHKIRVFEAARDLFGELDEFALACGEVSSISKRDGRLVGHAKDPVTAGLSLEEFMTPGRLGGTDAVCLGAGGSATAITWYLARRSERPDRIVCTARRSESLARMRDVHERGGLDARLFRYVTVASQEESDRIVEAAADRSLVINATGLGKDRPGSPLSDGVAFPLEAIAWDFNYRGSLEFLAQARRQEADRRLTLVDGWRYFIHGWTQVVAEVFHLDIGSAMVERLAAEASTLRTAASPAPPSQAPGEGP
jgi:shikimate dehydrogenase